MSEEPDAPEVEETPEEFREQPGDREAEPQAEVAEVEDEPEAEEEAEEEAETETEEVEAEAETETPPAAKDWRDRQIAKLREREKAKDDAVAEATRRAEAAEALLAATPEERESGITEEVRARIRKEEAEKLTEATYYKKINTGLNDMDVAGKKAFAATWDERVRQAAEVFSDEMRKRPDFLEAVIDLPNATAVYHDLAGDPDRMESLLKMPGHKMGAELARLSDKLAKPPARAVSKAPAPIRPIERGGTERDLEDLINDPKASMDDIERRMQAEERKRAKAH